MIQYNSYLKLRRLVLITHENTLAYDETFHEGVNIIRGTNSSGKSTVANFIFYALGGAFNAWTTEARKCKEVFAEVQVNDAILTLKRSINELASQPMSIFWGDYTAASASNFEGWQHFPYAQSIKKESFSNILFSALGFPEIRSEVDSKITMNQVLRLLYVDQDSPTQSLFRFERFDLPQTRQAISELLLGVYDDALYQDRLKLREMEQILHHKKEQLDGIKKLFGSTGNETDLYKITKEIDKARTEIGKINDKIIATREKQHVNLNVNSTPLFETFQNDLSMIKTKLGKLTEQIKNYEFDIIDSEQFVEALDKRLKALDESIVTQNALGELPIDYCPKCLSTLRYDLDEFHCLLCKEPTNELGDKTAANRLKVEISLQIKESKKILEGRRMQLQELLSKRPSLMEQYRSIQREVDLKQKENLSTRDQTLDTLLIEKGNLNGKIEHLTKQVSFAQQLNVLKKEVQELEEIISRLKKSNDLGAASQQSKLKLAYKKIEDLTLSILRNDLDRQNEFKIATQVEVNFLKDFIKLDGGNHFSASSNVFFKNAVLFAIFFASLEIPFFRYPRFILCDNMEDKGMEQSRTHNFQKLVVRISNSFDVKHQIIFTTSMIEPTLNNSPYCVGEEYSIENKSLKV